MGRAGVTAKYLKLKVFPIIRQERKVLTKFNNTQIQSWKFVMNMTRSNLLALKSKNKTPLTEDQRLSLIYHIKVVMKAVKQHKLRQKGVKGKPKKGKKAAGKKPAAKTKAKPTAEKKKADSTSKPAGD